ncbi:FAD:protein FMN transferase [uncultured Comamonas sp.]|nr:FAD:protein FMN transferase [uncultured Comamonas sp.]
MPRTCSKFQRLHLHGPTMGTRWSVTMDAALSLRQQAALHQDLATAAERVNQQMSPFRADSDLLRCNRTPVGQWLELPAEFLQVLDCALTVCRLSQGAFDPGVGDLVQAWGFGAASAPNTDAIGHIRQQPRPPTWESLERQGTRLRKLAPVELDLCGIAKGFAVDLMTAQLRQYGVRHALVALDGELYALGSQAQGQAWPVAIESPEPDRRAVHGVVELQDLAIATSGDYRHYFELGPHRIAHSMDGQRQAPVHNDVASVTVLAPDCMWADAWATALLVLGSNAGLALARRLGLETLWLLRRGCTWVELGLGRWTT